MAINAKRGPTREPVPAGAFPARCYKIIHYGTIPDTYMGEQKLTNKIRIDWELPTEMRVFDPEKGEQPLSISKEYTLSMNEKANLCKDLESWRGKQFDDIEAEAFDISSVLGKECLINIAHKTSNATGNIYAYVASISPMPKGMECPPQINPTFIWDYDENFDLNILDNLHEFFQKKIRSSEEFGAKIDPPDYEEAPMPTAEDEQFNDLPF
jgi:hypothetical protein